MSLQPLIRKSWTSNSVCSQTISGDTLHHLWLVHEVLSTKWIWPQKSPQSGTHQEHQSYKQPEHHCQAHINHSLLAVWSTINSLCMLWAPRGSNFWPPVTQVPQFRHMWAPFSVPANNCESLWMWSLKRSNLRPQVTQVLQLVHVTELSPARPARRRWSVWGWCLTRPMAGCPSPGDGSPGLSPASTEVERRACLCPSAWRSRTLCSVSPAQRWWARWP